MGRTFGVFVMPWTFGGERHWTLLMLAGFALTGIIVLVCVRAPSPGQGTAILLAGGALLYAGVSALPAALISDPRDAGPRYYVLPFTATLWLLIHLAGSVVRSARERLVLGIAALSAVLGVLPVWHRAERHRYVELDWTAQVERCADADERVVDLPVFFDGSRRFFVPKLLLTPAECRAHS